MECFVIVKCLNLAEGVVELSTFPTSTRCQVKPDSEGLKLG